MHKGRLGALFFWHFSRLTVVMPNGKLLCHLFFFQLIQRLAINAKRRCWAGFQALDADLDTTLVTEAIITTFNAGECLVDLLDQLAFAVAIAQLDRHVGFLAGPIIRVGKYCRFVLHRMNGAVDIFAQLLFERFENLAEMSKLLRAHVILTSFRLVWSEVLMEQFFCHVLVRPGDVKID